MFSSRRVCNDGKEEREVSSSVMMMVVDSIDNHERVRGVFFQRFLNFVCFVFSILTIKKRNERNIQRLTYLFER